MADKTVGFNVGADMYGRAILSHCFMTDEGSFVSAGYAADESQVWLCRERDEARQVSQRLRAILLSIVKDGLPFEDIKTVKSDLDNLELQNPWLESEKK